MTTPDDYTAYCITAPLDPRLPGGGGYPVCNLANVSLQKFGKVFSQVEQSSVFGKQQ